MKDHFKEKSKDWDMGDVQVQGAKIISDAINKRVELSSNMEILDFGVGTGLLGFDIAHRVKKVYGVDTSLSMLEKLKAKNTPELSIETYCQDIITRDINEGGFIAIADLEHEDGTFHSDNSGVFHFGFEKNELCKIASDAGFNNVAFENINTINKPHKDFGVFLLTAKK
jgi:SAM-dependent methyltransferase